MGAPEGRVGPFDCAQGSGEGEADWWEPIAESLGLRDVTLLRAES